ncbi:MAG: TetR/AcrR family transcriptional regulator [Myxococcales bacterium]|nr:TetR/AcrR family transcriptional regulator [Myxococcales bacterium]MCB9708237.1 TetR/AcrR family transcriptional regulator [Myxococcales bacterium]
MGYKKSEASVMQIVEAATRVVAKQGYARTSLLDIAREAGMSKGALHYHFPTKESLIAKVLDRACDRVADRAREVWNKADNPIDSLRAALRELWRVRVEPNDEAAVVADLLAQSLHDPSLRPQLARYYNLATSQIIEYLEPHMLELGLQPRLPLDMLPRILHGLLDGLVMQTIVDPAALDPERVIQSLEILAAYMFEPV